MDIKVRTVYDYDRLLKLNIYSILRNKKYWLTPLIIALILLAYFIINCLSFGFDREFFFYVFLAFSILVMSFIMAYTIPKSRLKQSKDLNGVLEIIFQEDGFNVTTHSSTIDSQAFNKYITIYEIIERRDCIYLYISQYQAYILDKSGFINGDWPQLKNFLYSKIAANKIK